MTVRAVYFDMGGVIIRSEFQAPRERLAERLNMTYEDLVGLVFDNETARRASLGETSAQEHWASLTRSLGLPASEQKALSDEFFAGDILDRSLLDYVRLLRPQYKTGLISNAWSDLREYIVEQKFDDAFDTMVISAEVGIMKPDARIFRIALENLGVAPGEAVFLDDFGENIESARAIGMHAIHFVQPDEALKELKQLLANHK